MALRPHAAVITNKSGALLLRSVGRRCCPSCPVSRWTSFSLALRIPSEETQRVKAYLDCILLPVIPESLLKLLHTFHIVYLPMLVHGVLPCVWPAVPA